MGLVREVGSGDLLTFGVEGDGGDMGPVAGVSGPACRVVVAGRRVELAVGGKDVAVAALVSLCRG